jgi:serine/threonine protein kinase
MLRAPDATRPLDDDEHVRESEDLQPVEPPVTRQTSILPRGPLGPSAPRDGAASRVGTMLGPYRLLALIGAGGMGCVFRAEHTLLGRTVAIKVLTPPPSGHDPELVARFFQEARIVNRVRHPRIVDVTDLVELGDGTCFIVMELLAGRSLAELLRLGRLGEDRVVAIVDQVADALAAVHAIGVVHRDLKPQNIFVCDDGNVKLLDFGIAKLARSAEGSSIDTASGSLIGTPAYMSPEQVEGGEVDGRSDIYSLGVMLYQLLFGELPFTARNAREYAFKHLVATPPPASRPDGDRVRPELAALVDRCLRKRPAERYASVAELRAALHATPRPPRRRRWPWLAAAAATLAATATATALLLQPSPSPLPTPSPTPTPTPTPTPSPSPPPSPSPSPSPPPSPSPLSAAQPAPDPAPRRRAARKRPPRTLERSLQKPPTTDASPATPAAPPAADPLIPAGATLDPFER